MARARPDIAFLHGGAQGSWVWEATIAALQVQDESCFGNILALDIPGCGLKRGRSLDRLTPADVAVELIGDLENAGMEDIVLVRHSLAGNVLPALAELRPRLFRRLVYVTCSIPLPGQTVLQLMGNGVHGSNENEVGWPLDPTATDMRERREPMFCEDMTAPEKTAFLANLDKNDDWPPSFFSNTRFDFDMDLAPSTYVVCLRDGILPIKWQEKFAARFHAERIVRVDAGHQVMVIRPHTLAELLRLESREGAASAALNKRWP